MKFAGFVLHLKSLLYEFRKIKFPERKETLVMSCAVLVIIAISGLVLFFVDSLALLVVNGVVFSSF